jgi:hypothetical protein
MSQQVKNSTGTDGLSKTIDENEAQCVLGASLGAIAFVVRPRNPCRRSPFVIDAARLTPRSCAVVALQLYGLSAMVVLMEKLENFRFEQEYAQVLAAKRAEETRRASPYFGKSKAEIQQLKAAALLESNIDSRVDDE